MKNWAFKFSKKYVKQRSTLERSNKKLAEKLDDIVQLIKD
jgi:hypothetical protein